MATGEWTGSGKWQEVQEAALEIPSSLQQIESNDLTKIKELGRGQFGSVWLCRYVMYPFLSCTLCCSVCPHAVLCSVSVMLCSAGCFLCCFMAPVLHGVLCLMSCVLCPHAVLHVLHVMLRFVSLMRCAVLWSRSCMECCGSCPGCSAVLPVLHATLRLVT